MKKNFIISLIISLIMSIILLVINYINFIFNSNLLFAKGISGGEIIEYYSFGLKLVHIVPLTDINNPIKSYTRVGFDFHSFIIMFIVIFTIVFLITLIIKEIKKTK